MSTEPQIGRVRGLYVDFSEPPYPSRGDRVTSGKTLYYVLQARRVKRRDPAAQVRIQMRVMRHQDMPEGLNARLLRSALRNRGVSRLFSFRWYPREKKRQSFEQYMRRNY